MSRLTLGAHALNAAVLEKWEDATITYKDLDGFEVQRTSVYDDVVSKDLEPILVALADRRIKSLETDTDGQLHVTFVDNYKADDSTPFDLASAETVAKGDGQFEPERVEDEVKPPAKKAAAKKS